MRKQIIRTALCAAVASVSLAFSLQAVDPAPGAPPARGQGGAPGDRQGRGGMGCMLDEKQRELLREAMRNQSEASRKIEDQIRAAQKELMHVVLAEKQDEKAVREKAEALAKLQAEATVLRAKAVASVVPTLKPEQIEQLENSPFGMMLLSGGFGGGGGFGAGGFGRDRGGAPGGPGGPGGAGGQGGGRPDRPQR